VIDLHGASQGTDKMKSSHLFDLGTRKELKSFPDAQLPQLQELLEAYIGIATVHHNGFPAKENGRSVTAFYHSDLKLYAVQIEMKPAVRVARRRADDLQGRLHRRLAELEQERRIAPQPPVVIGGALVIPAGMLARLEGKFEGETGSFGREGRNAIEKAAMRAVMEQERSQGYAPVDVTAAKL
jgi:hypothetical protein